MPDAKRWRSTATALASAFVLTGALFAAYVPDEDEIRVREVVQQQLRAFESDDAGKAFALADPGIRGKFGDAEHFLATVRTHYPMVHRPKSVQFLKPAYEGSLAFQRVRMTDGEGRAWVVTYLLHRQQDHGWRIGACLVAPDSPSLTT